MKVILLLVLFAIKDGYAAPGMRDTNVDNDEVVLGELQSDAAGGGEDFRKSS